MNNFFAFHHLEFKRFIVKRNLVAWLIILFLMILQANSGVNEIKTIPQKIENQKKIQTEYFKIKSNYELYSRDGIKFFFVPTPNVIFSRNTVIPNDLNAKVDSLVTLSIHSNSKGKALAPGRWAGRLDLAGIISWLVSLLALWYGFQSFHTPEYQAFLSSMRSHGKAFFSIAISRLLIFFYGFLFTIAMVYLYIRLRGVEFTPADHAGLFSSLLAALVMLLFFFLIGVFVGTFGRRPGAYIALLAAWGILNFGIFFLLNSAVEPRIPDASMDYQVELDKYKKLMDYEKRCEKEAGEFDRKQIDIERIFAETYWRKDYPLISQEETKLKEYLRDRLEDYNIWCMCFPTTFYWATVNETSSRGYINYFRFYDYVQEMQAKFVRFYIDRVYYNDHTVLVNFIKDDEDIFRGTSCVPVGFVWGLFLNLGYGIILLFLTYFRSRYFLFPTVTNKTSFAKTVLDLESNKQITINADEEDFIRQTVNVFFGKSRGLNWQVSLDGESLLTAKQHDFIFIPHPKHIPGELKVIHVVTLFKRLFKLTGKNLEKITANMNKKTLDKKWEQTDMLTKLHLLLNLAVLSNRRVIVLKDFVFGLPPSQWEHLQETVASLDLQGKVLLDIISTGYIWLESVDIEYVVSYNDHYYKVFKPELKHLN